jgi:hypothetical protein
MGGGAIGAMARRRAAAVDDPPPPIDVAGLRAAAFRPERRCDCLVAEQGCALVGYAVVCRGFEAHAGDSITVTPHSARRT